MFNSVQQRSTGSDAAAVDIAPLIDVVFILLLFFLVTATLVQDAGVPVERPSASTSRALRAEAMRVTLAPSGAAYVDGMMVDDGVLRERLAAYVRQNPDASVVIIPDRTVPSGRLVEVMDQARAAGAEDVALATTRTEGAER